LILIDTSSWIHLLRPKGDRATRNRVEQALTDGDACWCPVVRLELWNGAGGDQEKKVLRDLERVLPELPITPQVWLTAIN
jgi:predicted nucleic acid-binding protein